VNIYRLDPGAYLANIYNSLNKTASLPEQMLLNTIAGSALPVHLFLLIFVDGIASYIPLPRTQVVQ
jgi:hypothetical protein